MCCRLQLLLLVLVVISATAAAAAACCHTQEQGVDADGEPTARRFAHCRRRHVECEHERQRNERLVLLTRQQTNQGAHHQAPQHPVQVGQACSTAAAAAAAAGEHRPSLVPLHQRAGSRPLRQGHIVAVQGERRVLCAQGAQEGRHTVPRGGREPHVREAHIRDHQSRPPSVPHQFVRVLSDARARVLRHGVRQRRRSHDAHPSGGVQRDARLLLCRVRGARPPVPARPQDHLSRSEAGQPAARHRGLPEDGRLRPVQGGRRLRRPHGHLLRHARVLGARGAARADVYARRRLVGPRRAHLRDARRRVALSRRHRGGDLRGDHARRGQVSPLSVQRVDDHHATRTVLLCRFFFLLLNNIIRVLLLLLLLLLAVAQECRTTTRLDREGRRGREEAELLQEHRLGRSAQEARATTIRAVDCKQMHFSFIIFTFKIQLYNPYPLKHLI